MANYPGTTPSFSDKSPNQVIASAHMDAVQDEIVAIGSGLLNGVAHNVIPDATANNRDVGASGAQFRDLYVSRGIKFPATQNASTDANLLDDYEENTWTPVIGGAGGTSGQTYAATTHGRYIKIGKLVIAFFNANLTAKGTITGAVQIQGLPFTLVNESNYAPTSAIFWTATASNFTNVQSIGVYNTTTANLVGVAAATTGLTALATADIGNTTGFAGVIIYEAAS